MSFGHINPGNEPTIYRGPMVGKAIEAMMVQVDWGRLDYLVIDLPPGTGDASLTLAQAVPLTGVAIVCTPQDVATDIAVKALQMFRKLNVTPLGLIENMSWYVCPSCGHRHEIFSHGGAESAAKRLGVPFLGAIPLEESIREDADSGVPVVISRPESASCPSSTSTRSRHARPRSLSHQRRRRPRAPGGGDHVGRRRAHELHGRGAALGVPVRRVSWRGRSARKVVAREGPRRGRAAHQGCRTRRAVRAADRVRERARDGALYISLPAAALDAIIRAARCRSPRPSQKRSQRPSEPFP